jgi:hypothetical protein
MAKIGAPIPNVPLPPSAEGVIIQYAQNGQRLSRKFSPLPAHMRPNMIESGEDFTAAIASWNNLQYWKKIRWSLCAIRTYGNSGTLEGLVSVGGYTLYILSYLDQDCVHGKQPISPCSRRATDPNHNPHDYTP